MELEQKFPFIEGSFEGLLWEPLWMITTMDDQNRLFFRYSLKDHLAKNQKNQKHDTAPTAQKCFWNTQKVAPKETWGSCRTTT